MTGLLVVGLSVPLVGAVAAVLLRSHRWVTPLAGAASAVTWAVLATAADPPTLGRIQPDAVVSAAVAGVALVVAALPPATALARSTTTCAITVLAVGASADHGALPDRPLGAALLGIAGLVVVALWADRSVPVLAGAALTGSFAVAGAGLLLDNGDLAGPVVVAGAMAVLAGSALLAVPAPALVPAAVLAVDRVAGEAGGSTAVVTTAAVAGLVTAGALLVRRRSAANRAVPLAAAVAAGAVLLLTTVPDLRAAGLLLAAGGVFAVASGHPLGLVATLPGLAAALEAFGAASEPEHALAGAAAVALLAAAAMAGAAVPWPASRRARLATTAAVGFGLVPLWGWSGAVPEAYTPAVAAAGAVAAVVVAGGLAIAALPAVGGSTPGRIERRPKAATHASTYSLVEAGGSSEGAAEDPQGTARRPAGRPAKPPVAVPPRPVPVRAGAGGLRGGRRLRARAGRPS